MAAIDKTYVNKQELLEAIDWAKKVGQVEMENGHKFRPLDFIWGYDEIDDPHYFDSEDDEYVLWNTPMWFDRWLWNNCPLEFVKERLMFQYHENVRKKFENYVYHNLKDNLDFGHQHYTFLKEPKWKAHKWFMRHGRRNYPWPGKNETQTYFIDIEIPQNDNYDWWDGAMVYDEQLNDWVIRKDMLPYGGQYVWQYYHKNPPTKEAIIRQLRKWYIPKGYIVRVYQLAYKGMNFEILVR